ncbi:PAAR domain-containing protein [Chitinophaga sp. Hz27]|uniref:PAAR domain-containing protein n=1 Tax=Chitinophaga sp. Hz27 TaxID=3347169 RepID=UPI0035D6A8EA
MPAATIGDMHVCPHGGGPIIGPGCPTVLIGGKPAAVMGDTCVCPLAPDAIILGSTTVLFGGMPAARLGDSSAHGGTIVLGAMNVLIG